jgi:hypothetical protein
MVLALLGALLGGVDVPSAAARSVRRQSDQLPGIRVDGSSLLDNGVPWVPRGVQIVGLVAPQPDLSGKYVSAGAHFGPAELAVAVADHADLIRFQVSEFGLDPQGPLYSPAYVTQVQDAVQDARALGLNVIVSLQAEPPAGEPVRCPLPDAGAARAWSVLAPMFAGDGGVMFELYNEPSLAVTAANWQTWLNGGPLSTATAACQAVGMQTLVDEIRGQGAENVIILPGLAGEQTLAGMPSLIDPDSPQDPQFAAGVHYPSLSRGVTAWDREFGARSATVPVIVTEWNANSTTNCANDAPARAPLLLDYLAGKRIGIVGFALDLPGTLIADWSYAPSSYTGFACGLPGGGPGQLLLGDFAAEAQSDGDSSTPTPPALAWLLSASLLRRLHAAASLQAEQAFDTPRTFVTGAGGAAVTALSAPAAVPTRSFADERALTAAVQDGTLPPGTEAVAYDDQDARVTPRAQQLHPALYYQRAANAAHRGGLLLIATPATNLVSALAPDTRPAAREAAFLRLDVAAAAARYADVYAIQAQGTELDPDQYSGFVRAAAAQASAAHPGIEVLAGLNTGPAGAAPPVSMLLGAVQNTAGAVSGYALNAPAASATCPYCDDPTDLATAFLQALDGTVS